MFFHQRQKRQKMTELFLYVKVCIISKRTKLKINTAESAAALNILTSLHIDGRRSHEAAAVNYPPGHEDDANESGINVASQQEAAATALQTGSETATLSHLNPAHRSLTVG